MDVFLHAEDPTTGDTPTLSAQLSESNVSTHVLNLVNATYVLMYEGAASLKGRWEMKVLEMGEKGVGNGIWDKGVGGRREYPCPPPLVYSIW